MAELMDGRPTRRFLSRRARHQQFLDELSEQRNRIAAARSRLNLALRRATSNKATAIPGIGPKRVRYDLTGKVSTDRTSAKSKRTPR